MSRTRQVVQISILGAARTYAYEWHFDVSADPPVFPLGIGEIVELPPNQVQEEGSSGTVVGHGDSYDGPMKEIVGRVKKKPNGDGGHDLWGDMMGQGDYQ